MYNTVHFAQDNTGIIQYTIYAPDNTWIIQYTIHRVFVHSTQYTVHSTQYTVHTVHSSLGGLVVFYIKSRINIFLFVQVQGIKTSYF